MVSVARRLESKRKDVSGDLYIFVQCPLIEPRKKGFSRPKDAVLEAGDPNCLLQMQAAPMVSGRTTISASEDVSSPSDNGSSTGSNLCLQEVEKFFQRLR
jgi:hypothetical protein